MIDDLITQLASADPGVRRQAIIALGKSKDAAALRSLADVYRSDPVPELRELARKAGVYIRQNSAPAASAPTASPPPREVASAAPPTDVYDPYATVYPEDMPDPDLPDYSDTPDPTPEPVADAGRVRLLEADQPGKPKDDDERRDSDDRRIPIRGREYNVPKHVVVRAKQYVDSALTLNMEGNNAKAIAHLTEAISLNPNLINDAYFSNVASAVTGAGSDEAVDIIVNRSSRKEFEQHAKKEYKKMQVDKHMATVTSTWTDLWWEVVIYTLIVALGPVFAVLVAAESVLNLINTVSGQGVILPPEIEEVQIYFQSFSLALLLPVGLIAALSGLINLVIQMFVVHLIARSLLGGHGTLRHLLTILLAHYNRWLPILFFAIYLGIALYFITLGSPLIFCAGLIITIIVFATFGAVTGKIGEAYGFSGAFGCVALILSYFLIALLNAVLTAGVTTALGFSIERLLSGPLLQ